MTQYWRMQLHPADPSQAMRYAVESVAAGFIGLDFKGYPGDLRIARKEEVPSSERDFFDFANRMVVGDRVLIIVHHFPFALVTVSGDYNYMREPDPRLGVWFRHFRRIQQDATRYFADRVTNARQWEQFKMTDTISILKTEDGQTYQLMQAWIAGEDAA